MGSVIVCGFYTEDYRRWLVPLVASLDRLGQAHDFVLTEKAGQQWETNTMAKARHILAAMDRHPDRVIVWIDVDCIVHGDLSPLADIRGDVAFRMHSKFRRHHKGARFRAQSGTMVFRPTPEARQFAECWKRASQRAPYGEIDQSSQVVAMAESIGTTFVPLPAWPRRCHRQPWRPAHQHRPPGREHADRPAPRPLVIRGSRRSGNAGRPSSWLSDIRTCETDLAA
jgi:hypothetical protein